MVFSVICKILSIFVSTKYYRLKTDKNTSELKRGLSNRHIQLIALGGAIGTGLFLGIGSAAILAGPSVILGYAIAGIISFFIMRQLGEMVVEEPVSGSFSYFSNKYWGTFAGFASGWNYWILYIFVSMAELTAIGIYINFWWPEIPLWASSLFFFVLINAVNLISVKFFGEAEFWFSIIKVIAIVAMILFGSYLLISGTAPDDATISNLWANGGFFPKGWFSGTPGNREGLVTAMAIIVFSFGGLELIGITAAEAQNPDKNIPRATNQVIYRILIFYVGALVILFSLLPWQTITTETSPFVTVFKNLNHIQLTIFEKTIPFNVLLQNILNLIVLTAALSVYNSSVYSNSRMLFAMAEQKNAPSYLAKLNRKGIPVRATLISSGLVSLCVIINFFIPKEAFEIIMALVVSCVIINWLMISLTHLKFKKLKISQGLKTKFPSFMYPWSNYICVAFILGIVFVLYITGKVYSVVLIPLWIGLLYIVYVALKRNN